MNILHRRKSGWTNRQQVQSIYKWAELESLDALETRVRHTTQFFRALQFACFGFVVIGGAVAAAIQIARLAGWL